MAPASDQIRAASETAARGASAPHTMRCLEVWGGNHAVDNGVVMAGLDAWLYSRPFRGESAGGDLHYVSSCAAGMVTRILIADVSGHGEAVSGVALSLRELMRRYVNYIDQTQFIRELNLEFGALSHSGGFATAVLATYIAPDDELRVCNAGHPRPLLYRAKTRAWELLTNADSSHASQAGEGGYTDPPLGVVQPACYGQQVIRFVQGDLIVLYTDSVIEARDRDGRQLGEAGLLHLIRELDPSEPEELMQRLRAAVTEREGGAEGSADDLTILILRPNGLRPRLSMAVRARTTVRMVVMLARCLVPGGPEFPAFESGPFAAAGRLVNGRRPRQD